FIARSDLKRLFLITTIRFPVRSLWNLSWTGCDWSAAVPVAAEYHEHSRAFARSVQARRLRSSRLRWEIAQALPPRSVFGQLNSELVAARLRKQALSFRCFATWCRPHKRCT